MTIRWASSWYRPKNSDENYSSPEKIEARQRIVDFAREHSTDVRRVLTLPAKEAYCAKDFKLAFPACHVVGVARSKTLVRNWKSSVLDEFYNCDVRAFEDEMPRVGVKDDARPQGLIWNRQAFEPFDLIFLDYTHMLRKDRVESSRRIIQHSARENATIALTFVCTRLDQGEIDYLVGEMTNGFRDHAEHFYENGKSELVLIMVQK